MRFRYFVLLLLSVIMGAGVLLVQTIDFVPYARSPISTHVYWQKNPTLNGVHRRIQDGEDVNAYSEYGWTPIMFAIQTGNTDIVRALVRAGADVNAIAEDSSTALMQAVITATNPHMIEALLALGADMTTRDKHGRTAYDYATQNPDLQGTDIVAKLFP